MLTVDYLLGDNKNRYFGRGHKRTIYEVKLKNILEGVGSLHQEGLWSSKQSEIIQQHLSTLDGIVLAHLFGSEILKRMGVSLNQYRLSYFEIKSGIKAIEELVNLKLELQNFKMTNQVIEFDCLVMVTHNREFAKFADRVIYLKDGSIEKIENNEEVLG